MTPPGLILLLGQSGVGKSTFINVACAADHKPAHVSHDLENSTSEVSGCIVEFKSSSKSSQHVTLIDTPGFNDTWLNDVDILDKIIEWLRKQDEELKVHGILYLHDISRRHSVSSGAGSVTPTSLSHPGLAKHICLVTVGWTDHDSPPNLVRREKDLREKSWSLMAQEGSQIMRFDRTPQSAWTILKDLTEVDGVYLATFVHEMENIRKRLSPKEKRLPPRKGFFSFLFGR